MELMKLKYFAIDCNKFIIEINNHWQTYFSLTELILLIILTLQFFIFGVNKS